MHIKANGIDVHYTIDGVTNTASDKDRPWVVLSHSLACDLSMWDNEVRLLSQHYRVMRYDTRGHGKSSAPAGPYSMDLLTDDAKALLDALGIAHCHWVGLSMGGMIGQTFALKYPGVFTSMTLADTTSKYPDGSGPIWEARIKLVGEQGMQAVVQPTLERWFTAPFRAAQPALMARVAGLIGNTPVAGYSGCCAALPKINVTAQLKDIRIPTLVLCGDQDAGTPVALSEEIHRNLPGSELVIIPSASHLSNLEQPEAFGAAISGFIAKHR